MLRDIEDILKLPVEEKLEIVEKIWDSIEESGQNDEIPDWHKQILEERLQKHRDTPVQGKNWADVKKNILQG